MTAKEKLIAELEVKHRQAVETSKAFWERGDTATHDKWRTIAQTWANAIDVVMGMK
jgi:hypothetical protein